MTEIKKGQMITFTEGVYSDYCVEALVVAIVDFELKSVQDEWESENTENEICNYRHKPKKRVKGTAFLPWLVSKGLVEDVDYIEIHTGYYDEAEISIYNNE